MFCDVILFWLDHQQMPVNWLPSIGKDAFRRPPNSRGKRLKRKAKIQAAKQRLEVTGI